MPPPHLGPPGVGFSEPRPIPVYNPPGRTHKGGYKPAGEEVIHLMAKSKNAYENLSTAEKTEVKKRKIAKLFRELPAEKKQFADGLIYQFAVTTVTLERLVDEINAGDLIEDFVQGTQKLRRENPALKSYNATIKSFTALSKSLLDLLPEKTQKQAGEELMNFATKPPGAGRK